MFELEHSRVVYWSDFVVYAAAICGLAAFTGWSAPREQWAVVAGAAFAGAAAWTLIEYSMHRFILHRVQPFKGWHAAHHERPTALISAPTLLSASLIVLLVLAPSWAVAGRVVGCALTLGVTLGYLAYATAHHATHHWRPGNDWMKERKRWHAMHHRLSDGACYGVSSSFWDRVFRTDGRD